MKPERMRDGELVEAILIVSARARMADAGDVRKSADVLADLAIEAGARIANRGRDVLRDRVSHLEDAAFHFQTCSTCRREGEGACSSGARFAAYLRGEELEEGPRPPCVCGHAMFSHRFDGSGVCSECACTEYRYTAAAPAPPALMGKVRGVVLHADGRLTCELEVTDAGAEFIRQIRAADPANGNGFRS